jgi:hypothetical protein
MTKSKKGAAATIKAGRAKMAASPLGQLADTLLGFALPVGKVKAAAMGLRAAGNIKKAAALESRLKAKSAGKYLAESLSPKREPGTGINSFFYGYGKADRAASRSVFPRGTKSNVSEGTLNIVDTRRMNPAQAKSALEKGVNQTATYKRGVPSTPKKVNKVTKRLLGGR